MTTRIMYNKSNQVLEFCPEDNAYRLYSYHSLVLEIVSGHITIDARSKSRKNYDGRTSVTTSKHCTQALDWIREHDQTIFV